MNYIPVDCNGLNGEHLSSLFYFIYFSISMSCVQWSFTSCAEIERELIFIFWKIWTVTSLSDKSTIILCWNPSETFWMLIVLQYAFSLIVGFLHSGAPTDCVTTEMSLFNPCCFYRKVISPQNILITEGWQGENYLVCFRSIHAVLTMRCQIFIGSVQSVLECFSNQCWFQPKIKNT